MTRPPSPDALWADVPLAPTPAPSPALPSDVETSAAPIAFDVEPAPESEPPPPPPEVEVTAPEPETVEPEPALKPAETQPQRRVTSLVAPQASLRWRLVTYAALAAIALALLLVPAVATPVTVTQLTQVVAFTVAFAGLSLLTHQVGLLSLGQGALVGVGSAAALHSVNDLGLPLVTMPLVGFVAGFALGAVLAVPSLRLPKPYLALITLSAAVAFPIVLRQIDGPLPVRLEGEFVPPAFTGIDPRDEHLWEYVVTLTWAAVALWLLARLLYGPLGRALAASASEPVAAAAFGVPVYRLRLLAIAASGALGGLAGALLVVPVNFTAPSEFDESLSIEMFALAIAVTLFARSPSQLSWLVGNAAAATVLVMLPVFIRNQDGWSGARGLGGVVRSEAFFYAALLLVGAFFASEAARASAKRALARLRDAFF